MNDGQLATKYSWMDKRVLCTLLGQPYIDLPKDGYWLKPAVSEDGLGVDAQKLELHTDFIVQPNVVGRYINVDLFEDAGDAWFQVTTAKTRGKFFSWFKYLGPFMSQLTPTQLYKVLTVRNFAHNCSKINLEFIGDYCIEAHARGSDEFQWLYENRQKYTQDLYAIPVWAKEDEDGTYEFLDNVEVEHRHDFESKLLVDGYERVSMVYVASNDDEQVESLSRVLNWPDESKITGGER